MDGMGPKQARAANRIGARRRHQGIQARGALGQVRAGRLGLSGILQGEGADMQRGPGHGPGAEQFGQSQAIAGHKRGGPRDHEVWAQAGI